ncbi:universal stress protein [Bacillus sp. Marseille-P3661]|uniref:universal stress protein n=1 Tax=Bacillus sp. Marseille-P3661 TaxID=1936234 RepID=UPI000C84C06B|nr:universal stress protein [Bacillus sp. Marseille-P3661]
MLTFYSRILVAYDGSDLSKKALEMAITLAKQDERIQVDVVGVSNPPTAASMGSYGIYSQELIEELKVSAAKSLDDVKVMLSELPNKAFAVVLEGNPGKVIVEFANKNSSDLIVMGSRGLNGLAELFLGSTSHYVVQRAHCPVFIVK